VGEGKDGRATRTGLLVDGPLDCCIRPRDRRSERHGDRSMERGNADRAELGAIRSGLLGRREAGHKLIAIEMGDGEKLADEKK